MALAPMPHSCSIVSMVKLVPLKIEHLPVLSGWFRDEREIVQWGGTAVCFPLDATQVQAMIAEGRTRPLKRLCWMAQEGGVFAGHAQIAFDWRNGNVNLGRVAVAPEQRGRGLASLILAPVLDRAFDWPEIERVELNVFNWNKPAVKTYARLGFVHEGTRRASARVGTERWDTYVMGMLRSQWRPPHGPVD